MVRRRRQSGIIILDSCNTSIWNHTEKTSSFNLTSPNKTATFIIFNYLPSKKTRHIIQHVFSKYGTSISRVRCRHIHSLYPCSSVTCRVSHTHSAVVNISQQARGMKNVIELSIGQGVGQQGTTSIWLHTWINEETLSRGHPWSGVKRYYYACSESVLKPGELSQPRLMWNSPSWHPKEQRGVG